MADCVLVTGGAGFIGSALVRRLLAGGSHRVVNVDRLSYAGARETLRELEADPAHVFEHLDVCDTAALGEVIAAHRPTWVAHLAAESHVDRSIDDPAGFVRSNVLGTGSVLDACLAHWRGLDRAGRERFRVLHVSTDEVYGSLGFDDAAFTEATPYAPSSPYAASKAGADHLARAWHRTYGLPVLVSNCSNNYGPYQFPEKLVPLVIAKAMAGEPIPLYGRGENVRDWLYVEDHVDALLAILERGRTGESYHVGGRAERSNLQIVGRICELLDELRPGDPTVPHADLVTFVADRPGHDLRYAMSPEKIERELGWRARTDFDEGLARTVAWYVDNQAWSRAVTERASYAGERLGLASTGP